MKRSLPTSLAVLVLAGATSTALVACSTPAVEPEDRTLTVAVDALKPGAWDPAQDLAQWDGTIAAQALFDTLVWYNPDGSVVPGLATGYEVSDDKKTIDITLRDDVDFVDGTHMDAAGVEKYYDYLLASDTYVFQANSAQFGIEFTATGEYELRMTATKTLFHPDYFTYDITRLLFTAIVLSPAAIDDPELTKAEPVGSGPYLIEDFTTDVELTLVRNPDYWDPERFPYDTIVLKQLSDPIAKLNALKSGQVDAAPLQPSQVAEVESSGLAVFRGTPTYFAVIVQDTANSVVEALRDVRVRQAIAYSFDREGIAESLDLGLGVPSSQAFVEGQAEYIEGGDERFPYDLEKARELMADAGYADGFDLVIPPSDPTIHPIVEQSLGDIGIRVQWAPIPVADSFAASLSGDYAVMVGVFYNTNTLRLLDEEFTGLGRFFAKNEELTEMIEIIKYGDPEESAEMSQELGEMILDEGWYIPFSRPGAFWGTDGDLVEVAVNDTVPPVLLDFHLPE